MIIVKDFAVPYYEEEPLEKLVAKFLEVEPSLVRRVTIQKKAIDARRRQGAPIKFVYELAVELDLPHKKILSLLRNKKGVVPVKKEAAPFVSKESLPKTAASRFCPATRPLGESTGLPLASSPMAKKSPPIVVGFGPAGMFAALTLARCGLRPLVLERGPDIEERRAVVEKFWRGGEFCPESNVAFGEGGAGTFSDGKLTTRSKDPHMKTIIEDFISFGAPEEIRYLSHPHIGTDLLQGIVKKIRQEILSLGGEVRFNSKVTDLDVQKGKIFSVTTRDEEYRTEALFLAIGHSARDTYRLLSQKGVPLAAKAFAMGVRIEHSQELINSNQYGENYNSSLLPAAEYFLTFQNERTGRGVYSFCMCPGGQVVAATSSAGMVVTNGMSLYARDSGVANSALLVTVAPKDFGGPLQGIAFQEKWERLAYKLGGNNYFAPVSSVGDFLRRRTSTADFAPAPTYKPGVTPANLWEVLPDFVAESLVDAIPAFDKKIPGFGGEKVPLIGVETRSSSPCRIVRDSISRESVSVGGLYPIGEGAGYAGGIMSSAADGIKSAEVYLEKLKKGGL